MVFFVPHKYAPDLNTVADISEIKASYQVPYKTKAEYDALLQSKRDVIDKMVKDGFVEGNPDDLL